MRPNTVLYVAWLGAAVVCPLPLNPTQCARYPSWKRHELYIIRTTASTASDITTVLILWTSFRFPVCRSFVFTSAVNKSLLVYFYAHMPIGKVWIYRLLCVCVCVCVCDVCVGLRLRISPPRIKLAASNFARRFIGVQGRESPIFVNFAPQKPKIWQIGQRAKTTSTTFTTILPFGSRTHNRVDG